MQLKESTLKDYEERIKKVIIYISNNLDKKMYNEYLAKMANFSPSHFLRIFKFMQGENLQDYVNRMRLEKAARLLKNNLYLSITEIAIESGFSTSASFARVFKKQFGINALEFRRSEKNNSYNKFSQPLIKNYHPEDYDGHFQVWCTTEDKDGAFYFGNTFRGILKFKEEKWRHISTSTAEGTVFTMDIDQNGTIYIGLIGDFGYLDDNSKYISLLDKVPVELHHFEGIWTIKCTENGVYFLSDKIIFRWHQGKISTIKAMHKFTILAKVRKHLFIRDSKENFLFTIEGDTLKTVSNDIILNQYGFYAYLEYGKEEVLILGREKMASKQLVFKAFIYNGQDFKSFYIEAENYLKTHQVMNGITLPGGFFAIGTKNGGVVIIDKEGRTKCILNNQNGLADNYIYHLFLDHHLKLWITTNNGISVVDFFSPFYHYRESCGVDGNIYSIIRYNGNLFLSSTTTGPYKDSPHPHRKAVFQKVEDMKLQTFNMVKTENGSLLVGNSHGYYQLDKEKVSVIKYNCFVFCFQVSQFYSNTIYAGTSEGLMLLHNNKGQWEKFGFIAGVRGRLWTIFEENPEKLWTCNSFGEVYLIHINNKQKLTPEIECFNSPEASIQVVGVDGKPYFCTYKGIYQFDPAAKKFYQDTAFGDFFHNKVVYELIEDYQGNVWIIGEIYNQVYFAEKQGKTYFVHPKPFLKIDHFRVSAVYPERDGTVWFGGNGDLICYKPSML